MIRIIHDNILLAILIRKDYKMNGIEFYTDESSSQQLGMMKREKGYKIDPHTHNIVLRNVKMTQEVLFVRSGLVRVDFYDNNKKYLKSINISTGDVILLADGGHGFKFLKESEIIEVKQGPYVGDKDKIRFLNEPNNINYE